MTAAVPDVPQVRFAHQSIDGSVFGVRVETMSDWVEDRDWVAMLERLRSEARSQRAAQEQVK
jgi:hypothetical protein